VTDRPAPPRVQPIVSLKNVSHRFHDFALTGITLSLRPGEVHAITGENGSGKSALMRLLSGWYAPDSGELRYPASGSPPAVSYVDQDAQTFENLTVADNVFFNRPYRIMGIPFSVNRVRMAAECRRLFRELGIPFSPETIVGTLGFAEREIINAVRALVDDAPITIFDAATSAMAEPDRTIVVDIVRRLQARGRGIFFISHRIDEILAIADRVSVIDHGILTVTRAVATMSRGDLVRMMTGEIHPKGYPRIRGTRGPVLLEVRNLASPPALSDVSFHVRRGEILGITGLMGSGRTRLANCLFGLVRPTAGSIVMEGRELIFNDPGDAMAAGISLIPEDRLINGIFPENDLVFNMTLAALPRFVHRATLNDMYMREVVRNLTTTLDIKPGLESDDLGRYSGGNLQKVLVARWLATRTRVCIMDEPTRGSDVAARVDIYNAINDLVNGGVSVVLISSEIDEILGMSDRILVLAGGRIAAEIPRDLATKEQIIAFAAEGG
jgi:ribose transport system ATP-binding protein